MWKQESRFVRSFNTTSNSAAYNLAVRVCLKSINRSAKGARVARAEEMIDQTEAKLTQASHEISV